jgi:hypothetical protein
MWLRRISSAGATHLQGFRGAAAVPGKSRRWRHGEQSRDSGDEEAQQLHGSLLT